MSLRRLLPVSAILAIGLIASDSCAPKRSPRQFELLPKDDSFVEREAAMDLTIPAYDPAHAAGSSSLITAGFRGKDRKGPKTNFATASTESLSGIDALMASLPSDAQMRSHNPAITPKTMERATEEDRNVEVPVWIYAMKYEADQDWHVIIGTAPEASPHHYFNAEVSGLPPKTAAQYSKLLAVRKSLAKILGDQLPTSDAYAKFAEPIPVTIRGSLFFDVDHAAGVVGPTGMRPTTAWEIHPISKLTER